MAKEKPTKRQKDVSRLLREKKKLEKDRIKKGAIGITQFRFVTSGENFEPKGSGGRGELSNERYVITRLKAKEFRKYQPKFVTFKK